MKITININCTPEEARAFMGLPDVAPMQEAMMDAVRKRLEEAVATSDAEALFKAWLPKGFEGLEKLQHVFWEAAGSSMPGGGKK